MKERELTNEELEEMQEQNNDSIQSDQIEIIEKDEKSMEAAYHALSRWKAQLDMDIMNEMDTDTVTRRITEKIKEHNRTNTVNRQVKVNAPHQEPNHPHL